MKEKEKSHYEVSPDEIRLIDWVNATKEQEKYFEHMFSKYGIEKILYALNSTEITESSFWDKEIVINPDCGYWIFLMLFAHYEDSFKEESNYVNYYFYKNNVPIEIKPKHVYIDFIPDIDETKTEGFKVNFTIEYKFELRNN